MHAAVDFKTLFELSPNPYMLLDRELRYVAANAAYLRVSASRLEDLLGRTVFEAFPQDPDDVGTARMRLLRDSLERVLRERVPDSLALIPYRVPRQSDGGIVVEERYWSATHTPILDGEGRVAFILQHTADVTELQRRQQAVRVAVTLGEARVSPEQLEAGVLLRAQQVQEANRTLEEERSHLRRLFDQAPGFIAFLRGRNHVFELANQAYFRVVGHRDIIGKPIREALPEVAGQGFVELLDRVFTSGEPFVGRGVRLRLQRRPGGPLDEHMVDFVYQPIVAPDGAVTGIFVQGHDITEQKRAQDELRRYREHLEDLVRDRTRALEESEEERRRTEAALHQAQKMEAIGQLTGGVAHDFNNLLQVIGGNLQLLQQDTVHSERAQRRVKTAIGAVERGAKLSSQLLAFARRQSLEPVVIQLGQLVRSMDELLRRALGEDVELETVVDAGLWNTFADPNQLENVILNLAINARDAMEANGKLRIEVRNAVLEAQESLDVPEVAVGEFVHLAVCDNGCGMPPEVVERAFEPFFTTKPEGRGTGLGLSMVYGFVKQSGGHIRIDSAPGQGTTLHIHLPRAVAQVEQPRRQESEGPLEGGSESILVVEDNAAVRATVVDLLGELGYHVLEAVDGQSALALLQRGAQVDLLFTDVVMPGPVRSPDLARQAKALLPDLEVLFTSGYTDNLIAHGGRLDPGVTLLSKPYRREDLARKLRHLFRNRAQRRMPPLVPASSVRELPPPPPREVHLRILLVEDDESIRSSAVELLTLLGHHVYAAASAEAAHEALARDRFDVLFTDVSLPGASGLELARRAVQLRPVLKVIIASGVDGPSVEGLPGAVVLPKPYDLFDMESALAKAVVSRTKVAATR